MDLYHKKDLKMKDLTNSFSQNCRQIFQIAFPIMVTRIINAANLFIGMLMIAQLGTIALAASALTTSIYFAIILFGMGILFSIGIFVGGALGKQDNREVGNVINHGLVIAFMLGIIGWLIMFNIGTLLQFLGQNEQVISLVQSYFKYAAFGIFPCLGLVVLQQFVIAIGRPLFATISILITLPINIFLSYCLLFGKFGLPQLGMDGVALAITINFWLVFITVGLYLYFNSEFNSYSLFKNFNKINSNTLKAIFRLGWPISMQFAIELCAYAGGAILMGMISTDALAAQQIVTQSAIIASIAPFSIAQATSILISKKVAAQEHSTLNTFVFHSIITVSIVAAIIALLYLIMPYSIASIYLHANSSVNQEIVLSTAILLLNMFALTQLLDSIRNVLGSCLSGLRKTKPAMLIAFISCWIFALPIGYFLGIRFNFGPIGIAIGFQVAFAVGIVALFFEYKKHIMQANFSLLIGNT